MNIADQIYNEVRALPEHLALEVLDFIGFTEHKHGLKTTPDRDLLQAQAPAMDHVWDNPTDDEVWNDV
jgi:hypothetical protein